MDEITKDSRSTFEQVSLPYQLVPVDWNFATASRYLYDGLNQICYLAQKRNN